MRKERIVRMAVAIMLFCPLAARSQEAQRHVEFGLGGSAINHTRTMLSDFHRTEGGGYLFTLKEKSLYGGADFYFASEIKPWLYADLQTTLGLVHYHKDGRGKNGWSVLAGPGLQFRPSISDGRVQPFLRLGAACYHKNFPTTYFGSFDGDVTDEAVWRAEDSWNKGSTSDSDTSIALSAGLGLLAWINDKVGVLIQADYLRTFGSKGANFAQGSLGIVIRRERQKKNN